MASTRPVHFLQNPVAQIRALQGAVDMVVTCLIGGLVLYLVVVASLIQVDYFDSFLLLENAKAILMKEGNYDYHRFILAPLVHFPGTMLSLYFQDPGIAVRLSHLIGVGYFIGVLFAAYSLFRLHLPRTMSLIAIAILASIPLLIHYSPSAKEDIPGLFFFILALRSYLKSQDKKFPVAAGVWTVLAVGHRYNLGPVIVVLFSILEGMNLRTSGWRFSCQRFLTIGIVGAAVLSTSIILIYPRIYGVPATEAIPLFIEEIGFLHTHNKFGFLPQHTMLIFLIKLLSLPLLGLLLIGTLNGITQKISGATMHAVTFAVVFLVQTFVIPGKEARYLFLLLPSAAFLASLGLTTLWDLCRKNAALFIPAALILLIVPITRSFHECQKFLDPFYRLPFARTLSETAIKLSREKNGRMIWMGTFAVGFPDEAVFDYHDPFAYIYHAYIPTLRYYGGKSTSLLTGGVLTPRGDWADGYDLAGNLDILKPGDVLIINPAPQDVWTKTLPSFLPPILIQRVSEITPEKKLKFDAIEAVWARPTVAGS